MTIRDSSKEYLIWLIGIGTITGIVILVIFLVKEDVVLKYPSFTILGQFIPSFEYNRFWDILFFPACLFFCTSLLNFADRSNPWLNGKDFRRRGMDVFLTTAALSLILSIDRDINLYI